jgi:hypothetical protein
MASEKHSTGTARIVHNGAEFILPMVDCGFYGHFSLDDDWRLLNYRNGGSALALELRGTILPQEKQARALANVLSDASLDDLHSATIPLEMSITHSNMDAPHSFVSKPLCELPLFPTLAHFQHFNANAAVLERSGFWFGGVSQLAKMRSLQIAGEGLSRTVVVSADAKDGCAEVDLELTMPDLAFSIVVSIDGYADQFVGYSQEGRSQEILDCFAALYDINAYEAILEYAATQDSGMRYRFRPRRA